jgi:uroporphyrinogen decarboxylase
MDPRENLISLYRRQGFERAPVQFVLCPALELEFERRYPDQGSYDEVFGFPMRVITDPGFPWIAETPEFVPQREWDYARYYDPPIAEGARMDIWGVAHEPGGASAHHMTHMRHPLERLHSLAEFEAYPWPEFERANWSDLGPEIAAIHAQGLAAQVWMECTIWETAWYLRRMDLLMLDMALGDEKATFLLDKITDLACIRAAEYAAAGADILALGDDIGMQSTIMMSAEMYRAWIKPRLKRVIAAAKAARPDVIIQYHSCGYVTPLIGDLVEAGIDVLNPVQPECMDFAKLYAEHGDRLSFNGTIGTQTTMPFGTPDEVRETVLRNLKVAGERGGLLCCPTHMLEPEVPWENVEAYVRACAEFGLGGS